MGVQGLWPLLEPVGRRVNIESLTNKRLAIDASIWVHQFIKTMRAANGEVLRNAHLLGFFRRICKLLFNHVHPVFVFDGGTPALKRRTTIARRRAREAQGVKLRKVAERLLLARLKQHALDTVHNEEASNPQLPASLDKLDEAHAQQDQLVQTAQKSEADGNGGGAGPDLVNQGSGATEEDRILSGDESFEMVSQSSGSEDLAERLMEEAIAASMLPNAGRQTLEEEMQAGPQVSQPRKRRRTIKKDPITAPAQAQLPESSDEEGTILLPTDLDSVDPSVLSNLPASAQLDIITKMRERRVQANRDAFQQRRAKPQSFSSFQLEEYLKASNIRKHMDGIRGSINTANSGDSNPAKRIAGESQREYVFKNNTQAAKLDLKSKLDRFDQSKSLGSDRLGSRDSRHLSHISDIKMEDLKPSGSSSLLPSTALPDGSASQPMEISLDMDTLHEAAHPSEDEWEDVEEGIAASPLGEDQVKKDAEPSADHSAAKPHWRERMAQRQKFWSHATGFKRGRKLAEWGDETEPMGKGAGSTGPGAEQEDEDLQTAIAMSLAQSNNSGALPRQDMPPKADPQKTEAAHKKDRSSDPTELKSATAEIEILSDNEVPQNSAKELAQKMPSPFKAPSVQKAASIRPKGIASKTAKEKSEPKLASQVKIARKSSLDHQKASDLLTVAMADESSRLAAGPASDRSDPVEAWQAPQEMATTSGVLGTMQAPLGRSNTGEKETEPPPGLSLPSEEHANHALFERPSHPSNSLGEMAEPAQGQEQLHSHSSPPSEDIEAVNGRAETAGGVVQSVGHVTNLKDTEPANNARQNQSAGTDDDDNYVLEPIPDSTILDPTPGSHPGLPENSRRFEFCDPPPAPLSEANVLAALPQASSGSGRLDAEIEEQKLNTKALAKEHRKQAGISDNPTTTMYGECQELLQMFGIPYIIAPVEAEAQCAWLDQAGLVDGVVTDDNDVFLFGGRRVYRHIFSDKSYVEEYDAKDFESELGLTTEKLIHMALLLGSDYTEGIAGIGIVNAVEIVNHFEGVEGLKAFREWVMTPDLDVIATAQRVDSKGRKSKRTRGTVDPDQSAADTDAVDDSGVEQRAPQDEFKKQHQGQRRNWNVPNNFPDCNVIQAYTAAKVDNNKEAISSSRPDPQHLTLFCLEKFGWDVQKTEDLLQPILKAFDEKQTQATMDSFLSYRQRFAKIKSKRLQKAVKGLRNTTAEEKAKEKGQAPALRETDGNKSVANNQGPSSGPGKPNAAAPKKKRKSRQT